MGRVVLVVPPGLPRTAGNWTTAERLAAGLRARGCAAEVVEASAVRPPEGPPVILHALHALKSAPAALAQARPCVDRVVVTLTGTDSSESSPDRLDRVLRRCAATVAFHSHQSGAAEVIPPGVLPLRGRRRRSAFGWEEDEAIFLLPSGVRPVKDPTFAFAPLERLRAGGWKLRLVIAGPSRDGAEMRRLAQALERAGDWAEYLGEVPRARMGSLYRSADVVLNTSRSEGLSNALLEAMACSCAVLASDIPGNRAVVVHDRNGLLYEGGDPVSFSREAARLLARPDWRRRLGRSAARWVRRACSWHREIERHLALYGRLLATR